MTTFPQKRGEFTLLRKIGEGGMAEVFLAEREGDEDFKTLVALKRLHGGFALDQYFIRQLVQEAKLLGQLQHTNIVRVNDLRRIDDDYYIVMEYIDGIDVAQAIQVHRDHDLRFPLSIFFHIALCLCEALDFAHSATDMDGKPIRLIHRDIKPSNVLISNRGIVKLTDFGIARVGDTSNTGSVVKGTANYMSPEQASGEQNLTPASDIFSLGAVFWEMLTLEKLVDGTNYLTVINSIKDLNVGLKDITKKGIEPGLRMILLRMLARKRELRYQSMGLVLKDLRFVAEQMKVDLSPSHLRDYMAKITQLARDAAGRIATQGSTNLATSSVDEASTAPPVRVPSEPEPAAEPVSEEAAFAESVAALKALVAKDMESKRSLEEAPPPPAKLAPDASPASLSGKQTAPPQPPLPKTASEVGTISDDVAAPPSAVALKALPELAKASSNEPPTVDDKEETSPGSAAPQAQNKRSRRQKKKEKRAAAKAAAAAASAAVDAPIQAAPNLTPPVPAASQPMVPPAGVPTPPFKPKPAATPTPAPAVAPPPPPPPPPPAMAPPPAMVPPAAAAAPALEPMMEALDGPDGANDDPYDDEDWEGGSNTALYLAVAVVVLLLLAVIWLMIPSEGDPGGDAVADTEETAAGEPEPVKERETEAPTEDDGDGSANGDADEASEDEGDEGDSVARTATREEPAVAPSSRRSPPRNESTSRRGSSGSRSDGSTRSASRGGSYDSSSRSSDSARPTRSSSRGDAASTSTSRSGSSSSNSSGATGGVGGSRARDDDWGSDSSDVRSPYEDEPTALEPEPEPGPEDEPMAALDLPSPQQVLDDYSDAARRGRLGTDEVDRLAAIPPSAPSYENSRAVLMAQYEAVGDGAKHCSIASEVLGQSGNYADPQWNLEMSKCHLRQGRFEDALETSRVAELHAQDIPARSRTDRQLKIWEVQAKSYKGLYQRTENLDYLSDAIAVWKRYRHMASNTYRPREATKAEEAISALQVLSEGAL